MPKKTAVVIAKQSEIDPEHVRVIAAQIRDIAAAVKKIQGSGLTRRGLCLLLSDDPSVKFSAAWNVLLALDKLGQRFIVQGEK